jgi:NAD(P)-dependent dehydrogenase (short-subunit alcohol dehydrogenase family)
MEEVMKLENQSIIVTGGASGIGYHAARALAEGASAINGSTIPVEDGFQNFKNS